MHHYFLEKNTQEIYKNINTPFICHIPPHLLVSLSQQPLAADAITRGSKPEKLQCRNYFHRYYQFLYLSYK